MKTSTILLREDKNNEEIPLRAKAGKVLRYLLFTFMFLQLFMLYSCEVAYRTPRHVRSEVIIEGSDRGDRHDNGRHNGRNNHFENDDRH